MSLENELEKDGSCNGLLPDGTKPLPDPKLTYLQYIPLKHISGQFVSRISDDRKFEYITFKMSLGLNELKSIPAVSLNIHCIELWKYTHASQILLLIIDYNLYLWLIIDYIYDMMLV